MIDSRSKQGTRRSAGGEGPQDVGRGSKPPAEPRNVVLLLARSIKAPADKRAEAEGDTALKNFGDSSRR